MFENNEILEGLQSRDERREEQVDEYQYTKRFMPHHHRLPIMSLVITRPSIDFECGMQTMADSQNSEWK